MCYSDEIDIFDEYYEFINKRFPKVIYAVVNEFEYIPLLATRDIDKAISYTDNSNLTDIITKEVKTFYLDEVMSDNIAVYTDENNNRKYEVEALDREGLGSIYPITDYDNLSEENS